MKSTYKLEIARDENGNLNVKSENDGFNGFEVLGFLTMKQDDILKQLSGQITPDVITRTVIVDQKEV